MDNQVTALPGSYIVRLRLTAAVWRRIGRLGEFWFPVGEYLYLGSAHGPGGLRARLLHHQRLAAHPRWHLDWLRPCGVVIGGWYSTAPGPLECAWSKALLELPGASVVVPGFGASDCALGCAAHLLCLPGTIPTGLIEAVVRGCLPASEMLHSFMPGG